MVRRTRRDRRAGSASGDTRHPRWPRRVLPRALVGRHRADAGRAARQDPSLHAQMGRGRCEALRRRCDARLQPDDGVAPARRAAVRQDRLSDLADRADPGVCGGARLARRRSGTSVRAHLLHGAVEFHRAAGRVDQRRFHEDRPADRRADRRPPLRRSWRAASSRKPGKPRAGRSRTGRRRRTNRSAQVPETPQATSSSPG